MTAAPPPELPDDLVEEILLRIPPDDPALLLRASLTCKSWSHVVSRPGFRRRLHDLHGAPPVLGFLHGWNNDDISRFIPATASPFSLAAPDRQLWGTVDCRHGRALFLGKDTLLVWEAITGAQQRVPVPAAFHASCTTAAVFCAADGCNHRDCLGGPFCLVFVSSITQEYAAHDECATSVRVYSSETAAWGEPTMMHNEFDMYFTSFSSVLVGKSLLYFMANDGPILEYDLAIHGLTKLDPPESPNAHYEDRFKFNLMLAEDGGLGLTEELGPRLKLWSRDATAARWIPGQVIYLGSLFHNGGLMDAPHAVYVLDFAEGANVIFVTTTTGLFAVELQSDQVTKLCGDHGFCNLIPIVGFYTPVPPRRHKDPSSKPSDDGRGDEEGEENIIHQAQQFLDNGLNVIKEGSFANAFECVSHDLENRLRFSPQKPLAPQKLPMYGSCRK